MDICDIFKVSRFAIVILRITFRIFRKMDKSTNIHLLLDGNSVVPCTGTVIQSSELLKEMMQFSNGDTEPIPLPSFVTKELMQDVTSLCNDFGNLSTIKSDIRYLIDLMRVTDYLAFCETTKFLLRIILGKLNTENCFEIFRLTNSAPYFNVITGASLHLMITHLNINYQYCEYSDSFQDPYVDRYKDMSFMELQLMVLNENTALITRISIIKNWWNHNRDGCMKEDVIAILETINTEAAYQPKCEISLMRRIRNSMINDINATT